MMKAPLPVKLSGTVTWETLCEISRDLVNQWPEETPQNPALCYLHEAECNSAPRRIAWAKPWTDILGREQRGLLPANIRGMNPALESEVVSGGFGDWIPVGEDDAVGLEWESLSSGALLTASKQEDGLWALTYVGPVPARHDQESQYLLIFMKVIAGARFAAVASLLSAALPATPAPPVEYPQDGMLQELTAETPLDVVIRFTGLPLLAEAAVEGGATSIEFLGRGPDPENMDVYHFYRLRGGRYGAGALALYSDDGELLWAEPGDTLGVFADQARACGVSLALVVLTAGQELPRRGGFRVSSPRK